ncbi:Gfo/Idh/MocA family protein [Sphingomonas quercus]|uniref:Gfo/Idh/MocA family oxidoreductase n=1 Tax=Sphingomonas quercus TaxID=2842451 RepID=A0ABS6BGQ0_9SPHN|nr:Gfo/Idh/MocA family oxidoreductase [Sphingomonas quercus]MBU3076420.1 Gfo/Idh/MocA family oxidoreductase [Sphingomonas quercus]
MAGPIRIAVIGLGKIAHDQHLPAIAANPAFQLAATASTHGEGVGGLPRFATLDEMLASGVAVDAVALCTPPQVRYQLAAQAIAAGKHVFLEKPPGATLGEVAILDAQRQAAGVTLFASWHSRYAAGVGPARDWLAEREIRSASIVWREDVRVWHPGQAWIWEPGGLGVFDPGINALSIATYILPHPFFVERSVLSIPANRAAPIAADLSFRDVAGAAIRMDLDWRQTGPQSWDISVDTDRGTLRLEKGGTVLTLPGEAPRIAEDREYPELYARFAALIDAGTSDVDIAPMRLVADAFLCGDRRIVEAFSEP